MVKGSCLAEEAGTPAPRGARGQLGGVVAVGWDRGVASRLPACLWPGTSHLALEEQKNYGWLHIISSVAVSPGIMLYAQPAIMLSEYPHLRG
jgi:hypothetical protein